MIKVIPRIFLLLISFLLLWPAKAQFKLNPKKNSKYLQVSTTFTQYRQVLVDGNRFRELSQQVMDMSFLAFSEYALSDRVSLSLFVPFKMYKVAETDSSTALPYLRPGYFKGLGNVEVGIRKVFVDKEQFSVFGTFYMQFPAALKDYSRGLSTGYDALALSPGLILSKNWPDFYMHIATSVTIRGKNYSDHSRMQAKVMYEMIPGLWAGGLVDWQVSFKNGVVSLNSLQSFTGSYANNQEFLTGGATLMYEYNDYFSIQASFVTVTWGNLIADSPTFTIGSAIKW